MMKTTMNDMKPMKESSELLKSLLESEETQKFLAEVQGNYIDWKVILDMYAEAASEKYDEVKRRKQRCVCCHQEWEHLRGLDTACERDDCPCKYFTHDTSLD